MFFVKYYTMLFNQNPQHFMPPPPPPPPVPCNVLREVLVVVSTPSHPDIPPPPVPCNVLRDVLIVVPHLTVVHIKPRKHATDLLQNQNKTGE